MSSYATAYLSDGRPVCSFGDGVDGLFFIIFTRDDWIELEGDAAYDLTRHNDPDGSPDEALVTGFRASAGVLRDRLDVTGVDTDTVARELERLAADRIELLDRFAARFVDDSGETEAARQRELVALKALDWPTWVAQLRSGLQAGQVAARFISARDEPGSASWLMSLWDGHDPRYRLRALLEALPGDEQITLDLDDLIEGGWLDPSVDPRSVANDFVAYASRGGLLPIVLAEGSFDVEVLTSALRVRRPHLADFIRFPDFGFRPEGGAAALRQTVRAFASAGIPNRVVALFDNDSAARDVVRSLDVESLPPNLVVRHLPFLPLAADYPTLGPQGEHHMDVNGLAASIELFLGTDVLIKNGALRPIEWRGYLRGVGAYQGEVAEKSAIQDAFRAKVKLAERNAGAVGGQDWSGIDLVLDLIVESIRTAV
ncbi:MAG: hypothetical protein IIC71_08030 [Acidobacteria bacterium]|nr:hypothetical protein [Acidobacteriota bacterium]